MDEVATNGDYVGLTDDRLRHMRQVGERCIEIAEKLRGTPLPLEEQKRWFLTGFLHDVGYRFSPASPEMLNLRRTSRKIR